MKTKKLVSVIIPIYNVESYLKKCVFSIISQTYYNIEIILVDDGSPDNCGKICDELSLKDERIIVIHKDNDGVSNARNSGMEVANGDYLYFIDGDDYAEKNAIETLVGLAENEKADLVIAEYNTVDENGTIINNYDNGIETSYQVFNSSQAAEYFMEKDWGPWNKLYARHVHDSVIFPAHKIHEDEAIMLQLLYNSKKIVYTKSRLYNYLKREGSTTSSLYSIKKMNWFEAWINNVEYTCINFPEAKSKAISKMLVTAIYNFSNLVFISENEYKGSINLIRKCLRKYFCPILFNKSINMTYKIRMMVATLSVRLYKLIYKKR